MEKGEIEMCEDETKPKSTNGETMNGNISAGEEIDMSDQTNNQSKTKAKNKPANKTHDYSGEDEAEAEDEPANVARAKSAEANGQCKSPGPTHKFDKVPQEARQNNTSIFRTQSEPFTSYKGRPLYGPGLFGPQKAKLNMICNKMASDNDGQWVNRNNCALNRSQNGTQSNDGRNTRHIQKSRAPQRPTATNALPAWKPFKNDNTKNRHPVDPDTAIVNYLKTCQRTDDRAVHASIRCSNNREEDASHSVQRSKTDSTDERCTRRANAWALDPSVNDNSQFINSYPSIYVSQAGLINIFLRWGIILEVTADKVLRLVDRRQNMAIATSRGGRMCSIHHPSAKIVQNESSADAELCGRWQVRRRKNHVLVADRNHSVWIDDAENYGTVDYKKQQFVDMSFDQTVNLPCSSPTYGPWSIPHCMDLVTSARFGRTRNSSLFVHLNDIHITQKQCGDVIVRTDAVVLRMRPKFGSIEVETRDADIVTALGKEIRCFFKESLTFTTSRQGLTLSNGKVEASLLNSGRIDFFKLPGRIPLCY